MKRITLLSLVLLCLAELFINVSLAKLSFTSGLTPVDSPADLISMMPSSVLDCTEIIDSCSDYSESGKFYVYGREIKKEMSPVRVRIYILRYETRSSVDYSGMSEYDFEKAFPPGAYDHEVTRVSGYPAMMTFGVDDMDIATQKGLYVVKVIVYGISARYLFADHKKYALAAMENILPEIPLMDAAPPAAGPVAEKLKVGAPETPKAGTSETAKKVLSSDETLKKLKEEEKKRKMEEIEKKKERALRVEKRFDYKRTEEYKTWAAEGERKRESKAEEERKTSVTRHEVEDVFLAAAGGEVAEETKVMKKMIVCDGVAFEYYPDELQKHAKAGESFAPGKWQDKNFEGTEPFKKPIRFSGSDYIPIAYLNGSNVTGYIWIDKSGNIVTDQAVNRALFTYIYIFGFDPYGQMKKEISEFEEDAARNDKEIEDYAYFKDVAISLKLASNAMSIYLTSLSGGMASLAIGSTLSGLDAAVFLKKMEALEAQKDVPDFSNYENLSSKASTLGNLNDLSDAVKAAKEINRLRTELQTLKDINKIAATKTMMNAAKATMLNAVSSFGWSVFDAKENTGQIAEQAAVLSMKYTELKFLNLSLAQIMKEALEGMADERQARNIFELNKVKAKRFKMKGDIAATLLESYKERKSSVSGYIGRFSLYVLGKSVDEDKAQQTIYDLEWLVDNELQKYYEVKIDIDVSTNLALQRGAL